MERRDIALTTELVYGTLRRQVYIDHALKHFSKQPLAKLDVGVRCVLRLGAHQLLHMRMPERAAVHATVELAKEIQRGRAVTYVNAVLRSLVRERANILIPPMSVDPVGFLSLSESFPAPMVQALIDERGYDATASLLAALNHTAPLTLRVNRIKGTREQAEQTLKGDFGLDALPTRYSPAGLTLDAAGATSALLRPEGGAWQAQDEAAQLVSFFVAPSTGQTVLDACAAPGGKSCHLAELMDDTGRVDAVELHAARVRDIETGAKKLRLTSVTPRAADATKKLPFAPPEGYDHVLVDAPCTGLGTIRRHPELKTRRNIEDINRLAELQSRLLDNLAHYVRPGGTLTYAVCTFTREEGPARIAAFLTSHPEFERTPAPVGPVDWSSLVNADGDLVVDPAHHGTDAFYAARLRRR